jgi:hypothetical protein
VHTRKFGPIKSLPRKWTKHTTPIIHSTTFRPPMPAHSTTAKMSKKEPLVANLKASLRGTGPCAERIFSYSREAWIAPAGDGRDSITSDHIGNVIQNPDGPKGSGGAPICISDIANLTRNVLRAIDDRDEPDPLRSFGDLPGSGSAEGVQELLVRMSGEPCFTNLHGIVTNTISSLLEIVRGLEGLVESMDAVSAVKAHMNETCAVADASITSFFDGVASTSPGESAVVARPAAEVSEKKIRVKSKPQDDGSSSVDETKKSKGLGRTMPPVKGVVRSKKRKVVPVESESECDSGVEIMSEGEGVGAQNKKGKKTRVDEAVPKGKKASVDHSVEEMNEGEGVVAEVGDEAVSQGKKAKVDEPAPKCKRTRVDEAVPKGKKAKVDEPAPKCKKAKVDHTVEGMNEGGGATEEVGDGAASKKSGSRGKGKALEDMTEEELESKRLALLRRRESRKRHAESVLAGKEGGHQKSKVLPSADGVDDVLASTKPSGKSMDSLIATLAMMREKAGSETGGEASSAPGTMVAIDSDAAVPAGEAPVVKEEEDLERAEDAMDIANELLGGMDTDDEV